MWLIEVILMLLVFFIGAAFGIITEDRTLKKWFDKRLNEFYSQKDKEIEMLKSMLEKDKETFKLIEGNVGNDDERVNNLYKEAEGISNNAGDTKEEK